MKNIILTTLSSYLKIFPQEQTRQSIFENYLEKHSDIEITDWNNFDGHIVASGFIYAEKEKKFLVLYHKDMNLYLYPGGHIDKSDKNPLEASIREVQEETGLSNLKQLQIAPDALIPLDIDTHKISYNKRLNLPEHYHFDFRYLFIIDKIEDVKIDTEEASSYKWIKIDDLYNDQNYGKVAIKIQQLLLLEQTKNKTLIK